MSCSGPFCHVWSAGTTLVFAGLRCFEPLSEHAISIDTADTPPNIVCLSPARQSQRLLIDKRRIHLVSSASRCTRSNSVVTLHMALFHHQGEGALRCFQISAQSPESLSRESLFRCLYNRRNTGGLSRDMCKNLCQPRVETPENKNAERQVAAQHRVKTKIVRSSAFPSVVAQSSVQKSQPHRSWRP